MPLLMRFTFSDSSTKDFTYPVDIWRQGATYTASYDFPGKTVTTIWIDQGQHFVDVNRFNNRWLGPTVAGAVTVQGKAAGGGPPAVHGAAAGGDSVTTPLTAADLAHYLAVKRALGPYWYGHQWLLADARASAHNVMLEGPGQPFPVGVFDYPRLVNDDSALAALFAANDLPPEQFSLSQIAVYRALGQLSNHAVTGAPLPKSFTPAGQNIALVYAHLSELRSVGVDAPTASPAVCTGAPSTSGAGMKIATSRSASPGAAAGIHAAPDDVTVVPFYQKPNETPLEQSKAVIEAEIDGHRGVFSDPLDDGAGPILGAIAPRLPPRRVRAVDALVRPFGEERADGVGATPGADGGRGVALVARDDPRAAPRRALRTAHRDLPCSRLPRFVKHELILLR